MMYLAVAVSGKKLVRVDDLTLANDRFHYLVLHGERNYEAAIADAEPYVALGLQLPPDVVARTFLDLAEAGGVAQHCDAAPKPAFVGPLDARLAEPLCRLLSCLDDPLDRRVVAPLLIREIVFRLLRSEAAGVLRSSTSTERVKIVQAMSFIERHAAKRLTVGSIARSVAMSPSHFAHRFRELASISPMQYLKLVRLDNARMLLLDDSIAVGQVCESVGYASPSHFSRDFRRRFGVAPSAYASAFATHATIAIDRNG
jgi:AraC-like DNA-binding protein